MDGLLGSLNSNRSLGVPIAPVMAMIGLAALDFIGAICAKEWTNRQQTWLLLAGAGSFLILFALYAMILKTAELSIVTIGWVVFLQVGVLLVDRFHYGASLSRDKWIAIVIILLLQAYLVLAPSKGVELP